jgi:hypothetical protein
VPAAAGLALLAYVVGSSSGQPAGQIALTTPDAPSTAAGTHQAAATGSKHGHVKARHGALPITSLFPGHSTQGILPVPSPGTSSYTPAPNPSTASSAPSSQPSSIGPPPSHKASPTPTTTKPTPTPTLTEPSPTPTATPTSSTTSSPAGTSTSPATTSPTVQTVVSVAIDRLVPLGTLGRYLT